MKYLIVGLGNPGPEYELTRHNIGFLTLDRLADKKKSNFEPGRLADVCEIKHKGRLVHLIKPNTYMNRSGKAVNYWLQQLKISIDNLLIVTDDIALPFGKLRMRGKGSSAGHNGLKDIESTLGTSQYSRLKFGIGDNYSKGRQVDYVLGRFPNDEIEQLTDRMDKASEMILSFATIGISKTMTLYNE